MTDGNAAEGTAPTGAVAPAGVKGAMAEFVGELTRFRETIETKLQAQENRMTMLDRKTAFRGRAPLSTAAETEAPHQKAFAAYLRQGDDSALRGLVLEEKGITVATDGGFLAAPQISADVQDALRNGGSLRAISTVVQVDSPSYEVLIDRADLGSGWSGEGAVAETDAPRVDRVSIPLHELSAMPKVSQRLLDDAAFDLEGWLAARIAERFNRAEANAFLNGDGVDKPKGLLTYAHFPYKTATEMQIGRINTGVSTGLGSDPAGLLVELTYALAAPYRANASFVMNSRIAMELRKLRDTEGRFIWADSLAAGQPSRLLGYPVVICEDMHDAGTSKIGIAFGDFAAAYTIAERPELRVLRDPFSAKPHVLFYATKRVGGGLTDPRAVKFLVFG